jgi:hypothetical protein
MNLHNSDRNSHIHFVTVTYELFQCCHVFDCFVDYLLTLYQLQSVDLRSVEPYIWTHNKSVGMYLDLYCLTRLYQLQCYLAPVLGRLISINSGNLSGVL